MRSRAVLALSTCLYLIALFFATAACNSKSRNGGGFFPIIAVIPGASTTGNALIGPVDFGNVALLTGAQTRVLTLKNIGGASASLGNLTSQDIGLTAPFSYKEPLAENGINPCTPNTVLAPNDACLISLEFLPEAVGTFNANLNLTYTDTPPATPTAPQNSTAAPQATYTATAQLTGRAYLDCQVSTELSAAYQEGVAQANAQMEQDRQRGTADGQALTYNDGYNEGYANGYNVGYNAGYNSADSYNRGYNEGYAAGEYDGLRDVASCDRGATDGSGQGARDGANDGNFDGYNDGYNDGYASGGNLGYADGYNDGYAAGQIDGVNAGTADEYNDGYNTGYPVGQTDGYNDGYFDGSVSCSSTTQRAFTQALDPSQFTAACTQQGYNATYSTQAYWDAYNAAKAANQEYQRGKTDGYNAGHAAGYSDGQTRGRTDGYNAGYSAGFQTGSGATYTSCYNNAYTSAYSNAYANAYNSAYIDGSIDGSNDAYADAYNDGYNVGYNDGYSDGYWQAQNSSAWADGYNAGYSDGYSSGYFAGYQDGQNDTCGASVESVSALKLSVKTALARRQATKTQRASAPARAQTTVKPYVQRTKPVVTSPNPKRYGSDQAWWQNYGPLSRSTFVQSKLPASVVDSLARTNSLQSFTSQRDLHKAGSLRSNLRSQAKSKRSFELGRRQGWNWKPATTQK